MTIEQTIISARLALNGAAAIGEVNAKRIGEHVGVSLGFLEWK